MNRQEILIAALAAFLALAASAVCLLVIAAVMALPVAMHLLKAFLMVQ